MDNPGLVEAVRAFSRFHARTIGMLEARAPGTDVPLPQARILQEIGSADRPASAAELSRDLALDPGYVSRLVAQLETSGLVERTPAPDDRRRLELTMTDAGSAVFAAMDRTAAQELGAMLARLGETQQRSLVEAMRRIEALLSPAAAPPVVLRDPAPGDLGVVIQQQARLYAREYGFDVSFEGFLAGIMADFVKGYDPAGERAFVADRAGAVVGAVFVVREDVTTAKLRMLHVEPDARGLGVGKRLVAAAVGFAREAGYRRMGLWTNDILLAARRIYEAAGFTLDEEERHHSFGQDLVGQFWSLDLTEAPAPPAVAAGRAPDAA